MTDPTKGPTERSEGGRKGGARGGVRVNLWTLNPANIKWARVSAPGTVVYGTKVNPGDWVGIDSRGAVWLARRFS
jgi:hypothetical protein